MNARLSRILKSQQVPHAMLFAGPKGGGKTQEAYEFSTHLLSTKKKVENHPDIHLYFPEGKTGVHPISSIRRVAHDAALAPFEGAWKVFILHEAEKMPPTSSNALLKTLEEPPSRTVIILICDHPARLLPTVLSRCQTIEFPAAQEKKVDSTLLALLAGDSSQERISSFESESPNSVFETILFWYRDRLLLEIGGCDTYLHFPNYLPQLKKTPLLPLEEVEKGVNQARLAFERSTKLSTCLEMLFLYLKFI